MTSATKTCTGRMRVHPGGPYRLRCSACGRLAMDGLDHELCAAPETDRLPIAFRLGRWKIEEQRPPVPLDAWQAVHDDYDGPEDHVRLVTTTWPNDADTEVWNSNRVAALRDLLDEIVEREAEAALDEERT